MASSFDAARWAQDALDVQGACNLSGVVAAFARMTHEMRASGMDTPTCNKHFRSVLFSAQIAALTESEESLEYSKAYGQALAVVQGAKDMAG